MNNSTTENWTTLQNKLNAALYKVVDLYFKDNGDHFTVFFISERAMTCAKNKIAFEPHLYTRGKNLYINAENHLLTHFISWAMTNSLTIDRGDFQLPVDEQEPVTMYDRITIGSTVQWRNKSCIVCNRFPNGTLVISPKGNGDSQAKYYTVKDRDVCII